MLPITGVYELAIPVKDLARAEAFYMGTLGFQEGIRNTDRNRLFLYVGGKAGMIVLIEDKGEWPTLHFAFSVADRDLEPAAAMLKEKGVAVGDPVIHDWMGSRSVYFDDPDGHQLEFISLLEESRSAEAGK
jgi:lactoylglutathione lyase